MFVWALHRLGRSLDKGVGMPWTPVCPGVVPRGAHDRHGIGGPLVLRTRMFSVNPAAGNDVFASLKYHITRPTGTPVVWRGCGCASDRQWVSWALFTGTGGHLCSRGGAICSGTGSKRHPIAFCSLLAAFCHTLLPSCAASSVDVHVKCTQDHQLRPDRPSSLLHLPQTRPQCPAGIEHHPI